MNARAAFDTHAFVKRLEAAGMSVAQAEALTDALGEVVLGSVATKSDLTELGSRLRDEIRGVELRLTMRMGVITASSTALTVAILGVLITLS